MARIPVECITEMRPDYIRPWRIPYEDVEGSHVIKVHSVVGKDAKKVLPAIIIPHQ